MQPRGRAAWRRVSGGTAAVALLWLGGVAAAETVHWFDHAHHAAQGVECADCHTLDDDGVRRGGADPEFCTDCHDAVPERLRDAARPPRRLGDLRFVHARHQPRVGCVDCHGDLTVAGRAPRSPTGAECLSCHAGRGVSSECAQCHGAATFRPATHQPSWARRHGRVAELAAAEVHGGRCADCHAGDGCRSCHLRSRPRDHTAFWRRRGHGWRAVADRERCAVCHVEAYCIRCHRETPPLNHRGSQWSRRHGQSLPGWLSGDLGNCQLCHPLGFCARCHSRSR